MKTAGMWLFVVPAAVLGLAGCGNSINNGSGTGTGTGTGAGNGSIGSTDQGNRAASASTQSGLMAQKGGMTLSDVAHMNPLGAAFNPRSELAASDPRAAKLAALRRAMVADVSRAAAEYRAVGTRATTTCPTSGTRTINDVTDGLTQVRTVTITYANCRNGTHSTNGPATLVLTPGDGSIQLGDGVGGATTADLVVTTYPDSTSTTKLNEYLVDLNVSGPFSTTGTAFNVTGSGAEKYIDYVNGVAGDTFTLTLSGLSMSGTATVPAPGKTVFSVTYNGAITESWTGGSPDGSVTAQTGSASVTFTAFTVEETVETGKVTWTMMGHVVTDFTPNMCGEGDFSIATPVPVVRLANGSFVQGQVTVNAPAVTVTYGPNSSNIAVNVNGTTTGYSPASFEAMCDISPSGLL